MLQNSSLESGTMDNKSTDRDSKVFSSSAFGSSSKSDIGNNRGTITWSEFQLYCSEFCLKAGKLRDEWLFRKLKEEEPGHSYLEKRITSVGTTTATVSMATVREEDLEDAKAPQNDDGEEDNGVVPDISNGTLVTKEYHVLYSLSYSVPILYFNMWKQDGSLLQLDEVWRQIPLTYRDEFNENKWGTISQQEHPLLGRPYFYVHPCQTESLMKQCNCNLKNEHGNYLITWLSMFGPLVGLNIPLAYGQDTN